MNRAAAMGGAGLVLVLLTALVSGVSTFANLYAIKGTSSDAFVTVRNIVVAAAFVPVALVAARYLRAPALRPADWARLVVIGLIGGAIPFLLFFHGLALASAAKGSLTASFVYRTLFLFATVFGVVFLAERFHWRVALAAGLLLGGNVLLLSFTAPVWTDGSLYVLAATILWAAEYTLSKRTLRDLPSTTVMLGRMGFGAVFLAGYLALTAQWATVATFSSASWDWVGISAALLIAFVATFYAGLKRVDVGVATSVLVLGFPVTWLLSVLVQGSSFTVGQALGVVAIVVGVVLAIGVALLRDTGLFLQRLLRPSAASS